MKKTRFVFPLLALVFLATCSGPSEDQVKLQFTIGHPGPGRYASSVSGFSCFGVLVTGDRIKPKDDSADKGFVPGDYCSYAGISSSFVGLKAGGATVIDVSVPSQSPLLIQVVALDISTGVCPGGTVSDFLVDTLDKGTLPTVTGLYEVGRKVVSPGLSGDQQIDIANSYDSAAPLNLLTCSSATRLKISPSRSAGIDASGKLTLQASGGSGSYIYTLNGPGSLVSNGFFTAPSGGGQVSYVTVRDAANSKLRATTRFQTFAPTSPAPLFWYAANSYTQAPSRAALTSGAGDNWVNAGSLSGFDLSVVDYSGNGGAMHTYVPAALNGFPAIGLLNQANFHKGSLTTSILNGLHAFVVSKLYASSSGWLFCLSASGTSCNNTDDSVGLLANSMANPATLSAHATHAFSGTDISSTLTTNTGSFSLAEVQANLPGTGGSDITLKVNGVPATSGATANSLALAASGSGYFHLGLPTIVGTNGVDADIAEVLVFGQQLSALDAASVNAYLKHKYRL